MKNFKIVIVAFTIIFSISVSAQKSNIFLDGTFWETNPSIETIDIKIKEGNNINASNTNAFDAVTYALLRGVDNKSIKYILSKKGSDVNKLTHDGRTYIFWAAYKNNLEMVDFLLSKGAKTDVIDTHGNTFLNFAAGGGLENTKIYDLGIKNGADIKNDKTHNGSNALLLIAGSAKNYNIIKYFISKGASLSDTDNNGNNIFNYAAKSGNLKLMKILVEKGVSYKELNKEGGNAIIFASLGARMKQNTIEIYNYLESLGINPNITTKTGTTPLHAISRATKDLEIIKYFLSKGINANQLNADGNNALIIASSRNNLNIIKFLANETANINHQNKKGVSALTNAILNNTVKVASFLISKGANVNLKDKKGNNLAYYLIKSYSARNSKSFSEKLSLLKTKNLSFSEKFENSNNLFHIALDKNNIDLLKQINALGIVDINTKNDDGNTVLHLASMKAKDDKIIKYLISIGADKNLKTDFEETAYDLALENEILKNKNINITFLK